MATRDLSSYNPAEIPSAEGFRFGIVVSDWNHEVTHSLLKGAVSTLKKHGVSESEIVVRHVPGSFELTLGAQWLAEYDDLDGVICLGCVIQGETPHFTYICQGVTQGITTLNMEYNIPFIFGVLTTDTHQQALDRAGGRHGNKGDEAAITAIKMAALQKELENQ
ncbi:MAG: 6,7-dimethyl-8-ribityllumazine synthase [Bacteroidetes bacterium]|nr:6,7-dimethyl-8-ribityllumazine synthase [Bacteroidota bacterium]